MSRRVNQTILTQLFMLGSKLRFTRLTREQVNILKGVGIFLIVLHNFYHLAPPNFEHTEFYFSPTIVEKHIQHLAQSPLDVINLFFSYWGHYGVEIFIFLSAYGVSTSLQNRKRTYATFIYQRFEKLYISFFIAVILYVILRLLVAFVKDPNNISINIVPWHSILYKLLLISNFIPDEAVAPVGPWWFIPFIFQTYAILPIIIWLYKKYNFYSLAAIAAFGYLLEALYPDNFPSVNFTPLGHLPIICLGVFASFKNEIFFSKYNVYLLLIIFALGHYNFYFWLVADLAFLIIELIVIYYALLKPNSNKFLVNAFAFLGRISLYLFFVNAYYLGPFLKISTQYNAWWATLAAGISSFLFSISLALFLRWAENKIRYFFSGMRTRYSNEG